MVFTIAHPINNQARVDRRGIYNLLFHTAAKVLKAYARKYLEDKVGFTLAIMQEDVLVLAYTLSFLPRFSCPTQLHTNRAETGR